jgi:hypothetical protein
VIALSRGVVLVMVDDDGTRDLRPDERARLHQMFTELYAERGDGEPEHEEQRLQTRVERLRHRYADLLGPEQARKAEHK